MWWGEIWSCESSAWCWILFDGLWWWLSVVTQSAAMHWIKCSSWCAPDHAPQRRMTSVLQKAVQASPKIHSTISLTENHVSRPMSHVSVNKSLVCIKTKQVASQWVTPSINRLSPHQCRGYLPVSEFGVKKKKNFGLEGAEVNIVFWSQKSWQLLWFVQSSKRDGETSQE